MQDFKKLRVWHEGVDLAAWIYRATAALPESERFGLTAQMRSAVVSVSSNIAEGAGRGSHAVKARFLQMAIGSTSELESQILVVQRLELMGADGLLDRVDRSDASHRRT